MASSFNDAFAFNPVDEKLRACWLLTGLASHCSLRAVLDVCIGLKRAIGDLANSSPSLQLVGIGPVIVMCHAAVASACPKLRSFPVSQWHCLSPIVTSLLYGVCGPSPSLEHSVPSAKCSGLLLSGVDL